MGSDLSRHFLKLSYDGENYHGWQRQLHDVSVQEMIENAFAKLLGHEVSIIGCGRTDAGVHASKFYAHVDFSSNRYPLEEIKFKLNCMLPGDIAIHHIKPMHAEAHARFDATLRRYEYYIHLEKSPIKRRYCWIYPIDKLDMDKMLEFFNELKNYSDFKTLSKFNPDFKTTICDIKETKVEQLPDGTYKFTIAANRFLRNMVRRIIGTMVLIGKGKMDMEYFRDVMNEKGDLKIQIAAPPQGLFLTDVHYPYEVD